MTDARQLVSVLIDEDESPKDFIKRQGFGLWTNWELEETAQNLWVYSRKNSHRYTATISASEAGGWLCSFYVDEAHVLTNIVSHGDFNDVKNKFLSGLERDGLVSVTESESGKDFLLRRGLDPWIKKPTTTISG